MNYTIKTVLRYPGGKTKVLKRILPLIFNDYIKSYGSFSEYREPFVGGGSVFLALKQNINFKAKYKINDLNRNLYYFWRYVKEDVNGLINEINKNKQNFPNGKELYNYYKYSNNHWNELEFAARFFILNRVTFSGNGDSGGYSQESYEKRFTQSSIDRISAISPLLKNVNITNNNYRRLLFQKGDNVFIYLDPPYLTTSDKGLYGLNGDLHRYFDHEQFAEDVKQCPHNWLLTYNDSPKIRELYKFANIYVYPWNVQYGFNGYHRKKAKIGNELFISNYKIKSRININILNSS